MHIPSSFAPAFRRVIFISETLSIISEKTVWLISHFVDFHGHCLDFVMRVSVGSLLLFSNSLIFAYCTDSLVIEIIPSDAEETITPFEGAVSRDGRVG
jgi:hypothetical protein